MPSPLAPLLRRTRRLRRRVLLHRRPLAALCAGAAVLLGLQAAAPPPPRTVGVWTASRDLPGGTLLAADDLQRQRFRPDTVPAAAIRDPRAVLGRRLAAPMSRGEPLTSVRTVSPGLLRGYPGTTAVPVRVSDGDVVGLLRVGDRIGFVLAHPDGRQPAERLVDDVPVVALPRPRTKSLAPGQDGRLVVVAVPTSTAADVAARAADGVLVPVWNR